MPTRFFHVESASRLAPTWTLPAIGNLEAQGGSSGSPVDWPMNEPFWRTLGARFRMWLSQLQFDDEIQNLREQFYVHLRAGTTAGHVTVEINVR